MLMTLRRSALLLSLAAMRRRNDIDRAVALLLAEFPPKTGTGAK